MDPHEPPTAPDDVPTAHRGVPTYAPPAADTPPAHVRRPARRGEPGRTARAVVVGLGSSVLVALAATVLVLGGLTVASDRETVTIELGARPVAPLTATEDGGAAADEVDVDAVPPLASPARPTTRRPAPVLVRAAVTTSVDRVLVRLAASRSGRVAWSLTDRSGRAIDRARVRLPAEPVTFRVADLAAGRYTWRVVPVLGPVRAGHVVVAGKPPVAPPAPPPVVPTPPTTPPPATPAAPDRPSGSPDRGGRQDPPRKPPKPTRPPRPSAQPNPHQEVDPDDVPDPIDPSPRTRWGSGR